MRTSISTRRTSTAVARLLASIGLAAIVGITLAPAARAATTLELTTPYPAVTVSPGSKASFDLSVKTSTAGRVDLAVTGAPAGWTAVLRGGGFIVGAVQTDGKSATSVRLDVSVPDTATGTSHLTVTASGVGQTTTLGLDIKVGAQPGEVTLTTDTPSKKGAANATFTFSLTLTNNTPQDLTFSVDAQGPDGWTVTAQLAGQAQVATAVVKAGETSDVSVTANPPDGATAAQYPITVTAKAGSKEVSQDLQIEITGSYSLAMSTPSQVLSNRGPAGQATTQQLTLKNSGTAPITNVVLTASAPTDWKVTFDQATVDSIAPNQSATVTATITPSGDAIAGDYQITFSASSDQQSSASTDIRFTVETSLVWAIIGAGLIVLVFVGLWWVFRRYGRR
ncbi:MAG TPA: NEW3 domain-containing protein [Candidatus Limnocylindrales bacterium]